MKTNNIAKKRKTESTQQQLLLPNKKMKFENSTFILQEVWIEIFTFIPYRQIITNLSLVNHYFHDIILDEETEFWYYLTKYQLIQYQINNTAIKEFVTKYKIPGIQLLFYYDSDNEDQQLLNHVFTVLKLIEPFVTHLKIPKGDCANVLRYFQEREKRKIFPLLERLDTGYDVTFSDLDRWFGKDLSRFKQLNIYNDNSTQTPASYGSVENVSLLYCNTTARNILKQNLETLKYIEMLENLSGYDQESLDIIAPVVSHLVINIQSEKILYEPIVFSKLKYLNMTAESHFILSFFSVTHPLLTKVILNEQFGFNNNHSYSMNIELAQQPSIRYFKFTGLSILKEMLKMISSNSILKLSVFYSRFDCIQIDLPLVSNLELLELKNVQVTNMEQLLKQNAVSTLNLDGMFNLNPFTPYLSNIYNLTVHTLDQITLSQVLKLPMLTKLFVSNMCMTFECFTTFVHHPSALKEITIDYFESSMNTNYPVHVIAPLERLIVTNEEYYIAPLLSSSMQWLLFVISTLNVTTVTYPRYLLDVVPKMKTVFMNFFQSTDYLVDIFKKEMQLAIDKNYLKVDDQEATMILKKLETIIN
jgi:hypothetical protein